MSIPEAPAGPAAPAWSQASVDRLLAASLHQNTHHAVALVDLGGRITWCNAACERMYGQRRSQLVGRPLKALFRDEDVRLGVPDLEQEVASWLHYSENDRWMSREDGSGLFVSGTLQLLHDEAGEPVGFAKIMRNRTDEHERMLALRNQRDELSAAVDGRDRGMVTLAHELRSPLASVGFASAVATRVLGEEVEPRVREALRVIDQQVEAMARLVDRMLDLARAQAGTLPDHRERVVLQDAARQAMQATDPGGRVRLFALEAPVAVNADPVQLQQVLCNVMTNALKYSPASSPVDVRVDTDGLDALVRVQDHGVGIAPEMRARIFEMFTQADPRPGDRGLGIGLAVVKALVSAHGGTVQVQSDGIGHGALFTIRLPDADAPGPEAEPAQLEPGSAIEGSGPA